MMAAEVVGMVVVEEYYLLAEIIMDEMELVTIQSSQVNDSVVLYPGICCW